MPRRFIKTFLPDRRQIGSYKALRVLGDRLHQPGLWHLSRRSVAGALATGVFVAFIPIPAQMLVAAALSIWLRVNLPLATITVWITNPFTIPPMFYFTYRVGAWILHSRPLNYQFEPTLEWLAYNFEIIWQPLLLGSLLVGSLLAGATYLCVSLAWRWQILASRRRARRRLKRRLKVKPVSRVKPDQA